MGSVKSSTLPPLRVEPRLRADAERVLRQGETLSSFIVDAVEERIRQRASDEELIRRGLASRDKARRTGRYVSAEVVIAGLRKKLNRARKQAAAGKKRKAR